MAERLTVGLRYCGGCNPRFDRVAAVERLAAACPRAALERAEPGKVYDLLLIVGGCSACCADQTGLAGRARGACPCVGADIIRPRGRIRPPCEQTQRS